MLMSKQYGFEDMLAPLIARACLIVMPDAESGRKPSVNADAVRVVKLIGGNVEQSSVIRGMLLARSVEVPGRRGGFFNGTLGVGGGGGLCLKAWFIFLFGTLCAVVACSRANCVVWLVLVAVMSQGTITRVDDAKITVFGCGLESESTETAGTVLIRNAEDMLQYNRSEERALDEVIAAIAATGTNVVVSGGSISEMALHYVEKYNMMVRTIGSPREES